MDKEIDDLVEAVSLDSWCQECAVEHVASAVVGLLVAAGKPVPEWLLKKAAEFQAESPNA